MPRPLIALDADGVLLDFHLGYAGAWRRAFGAMPAERDPLAYWAMERWQVGPLGEARRGQARGSTTRASTWSACRRSTRPSSPRACATCAAAAFRSSA